MVEWTKQAPTGNLTRQIRAGTRRKPSIDGHTFNYNDLKEIWSAGESVVITHKQDPVWQLWTNTPTGGWLPVSIHKTCKQAQEALGDHPPVEAPGEEPGTYVCFRFHDERPWKRVKVQTTDGVRSLTGMYERLGAQTRVETTVDA
jgi:hypothetical protein